MRKSDNPASDNAGAAGTRFRGATELEGFVDQIAHLELTTPADPSCRERKFTVRGRLTQSPEKLRVSFNEDGMDYQVLEGNLRPIKSEIWAAIAGLLPTEPPGACIQDLRGNWPEGMTVPSQDTIGKTLSRCGERSGVRRTEGKPVRWWKPTGQLGTLRSPEVSSGYENN